MKYKIVLIKKYDLNQMKIGLSKITSGEISKNYQGFEGICMYFFSNEEFSHKFLENISLINNLLKNEIQTEYRFLFLIPYKLKTPEMIKKQGLFLGYEYGIILDEHENYSSVFQEVLLGKVPELVAFKDQLNEHFLFPTLEIAINYYNLHHQISNNGKNKSVELEGGMEIYEIWKIPL